MKRAAAWAIGVVILTVVLVVGLSQAGSDQPERRRPRPSTSTRRGSGSRARRPSWPRCTTSPRSSSTAASRRSTSAWTALKGTPIVINKWASWCHPCLAEFPIFQQVATERGKSVAFVGINGSDSTDPAKAFLAEHPVPVPVLRRSRRGDRAGHQGAEELPHHHLREPEGRGHDQAGHLPRGGGAGGGHRPLRGRMSTEVRVDPLTGLKVIIAAERAGRPGGGFDVHPQPPIDPGGDPFLARPRGPHAARAAPRARRRPRTPGWQVRVVPNLYPALSPPTGREPPPEAEPDLFAAQPATRRARGDRQRARAGDVAGRPRAEQVARTRDGGLARAHARARRAPPACT